MVTNKKRKAEDKLGLEDVSIDCSSLFNAKGLISMPGGTIDLSILRNMYSKTKEVFIPKTLFVRQEMIDAFHKLAFDRNGDDDIVGQVLIGAQGVEMVVRGLYNQLTEDAFVFMDGPNHTALDDTFDGKAHYLCTSGGHPMPTPDTRLSKRLVVLGGLKKDDLRRALELVRSEKIDDKSFETVFYLTGGRIRDALEVARSEQAKSLYMLDYEAAVPRDSVTSSLLATTGTEGSAEKDRWRTMFLSKKNTVFQVVDSGFKLALLAPKSSVDEIFKAYKLTVAAGIPTAAGCLFKELMHKWFFATLPVPVLDCLRGTATGKESVEQLKNFFTYWVPSTCNFANIDAALVDVRKHLHCLQYTVQKIHKFDLQTILLHMVGGIHEDQLKPITDIHIYCTMPADVAFSPPVLPSTGIFYGGVTYHLHEVPIDVKSVASIGESCREGFPFLETAGKRSATE